MLNNRANQKIVANRYDTAEANFMNWKMSLLSKKFDFQFSVLYQWFFKNFDLAKKQYSDCQEIIM
jgi:hypothetical protein